MKFCGDFYFTRIISNGEAMADRSKTRSKIYERLNNPELRCKTG